MVNKKKFHGGRNLLLLLLFIILLGSCSISYAETRMTQSQADYLYNYLFTTSLDSNNYINFGASSFNNTAKSNVYQNGSTAFLNYFNTNNICPFDVNTTIFFNRTYNWSGYCTGSLYYTNFNNGKNSNYEHLYLRFNPNNSQLLGFFSIDDNKNVVSNYPLYIIDYTLTSQAISFNGYRTGTIGTNLNDLGFGWFQKPNNWNISNLQSGRAVLENISGVVSFSNTNSVYTNYDGQVYLDTLQPRLLQTLYSGGGSLPDDPTPPSDTGNTGEITDNNGDVTGQIDLSGIQNQLGTINNSINNGVDNIIENDNNNTQAIIDSVDNLNETLTNDADNLIDNTIITSGDIEIALNFEIAQDPYSNFWLTLTNNLKSALLGSKRSIDISFQNKTWTISLDEYMVPPDWLVIILTPFSTAFFTWVLVRQFKLIFDKLTSGNIDSLLKENSEERHF